MAQNGPRMTQNDPKWPKNDPKWPKITPNGPKIALGDRYRKFYRTLNNAKKPFNSTFNSIFPKFIHSNKLFIYIF